jgi:hypothetical protein
MSYDIYFDRIVPSRKQGEAKKRFFIMVDDFLNFGAMILSLTVT